MLVTAIAFGVGAIAQESRVATLQHGSGIQAFYGENALSEAHEAAVDGDVITLSSGNFKGCDINKAITIRGEGMDKTYITGSTFNIPNGSVYTLLLEGLRYTGNLTFRGTDGTEKVIVSKCFLNSINVYFNRCNATVVQSKILPTAFAATFGTYAQNASNVTCVNSILYHLLCQTGRFDVQNCVLTSIDYAHNFNQSSIKNSIICCSQSLDGTNTSSHCLVKEGSSGFADSWFVNSMDDIFTDNYHLTESAAATYIGTDGTEIGIYGGMYPYDVTPDYPLVKRLDVIGSHKDGKLNVKINVE